MARELVDPELVVPTQASFETTEFWNRLSEWAVNTDSRLGPNTLEATYLLWEAEPSSQVISPPEYHAIVHRICGRVLDADNLDVDDHVPEIDLDYTPCLGGPDNLQLLVKDLQLFTGSDPVLLATEEACWGDPIDAPRALKKDQLLHVMTNAREYRFRRARLLWKYADECTFASLEAKASEMFPRMVFADNAWSTARRLAGTEPQLARTLFDHFSVLNDCVPEIWVNESQTDARIARLSALGVTASGESSNTKGSSRKMKERLAKFGPASRQCDWHTKLGPTQNRVHFDVEGTRVYVGLFAKHLPT